MTLPVAPLALLIALVPAAVLLALALAHWQFAVVRTHTLMLVIAFAVGVALIMASVTVAATYAFHPLRELRESSLVPGIPVVFYVTALVVVGRKGRMSPASLVIGGVLGLAPLCFLGLYAMLLSACSFGDCL
jgi:predicted neutral ceramidase superfamily lipid hydrolase